MRTGSKVDRRRWTDVGVVAGGLVTLLLSWREAIGAELPVWESDAFDAVNRLPDGGRVVWPVMQLGSLAAVPVLAIAADRVTRDRGLAVRIAAAGGGAYLGAKVVKHQVRRGRPAAFRADAILREKARGLGFVSGHAAEVTAMAVVVAPHLRPAWRPVPFGLAAVVGVARIYYGAHLPLDVIGGAALGMVIGGVVNVVAGVDGGVDD